jgi:type II secretory pathway pseudopilin PulG
MSRRQSIRRIRARLDGERGFTILETVIAIMVVFASLTALAYTASIGFRYVGYGRDRIQATGVANRVMEDIRGLAYTKITNGISSSELTSDSRIVSCAGTYRFETCSGEKIVSSTFDASYEAAWLVPHTSTLTVGNLDFTYHTYVTNDAPTTTPYRVTVIIEWVNGAIAAAPNNSVRLQSLFWSPNGCVNPNTHPFAAPCQPFFYGQVEAPQARLDITGQLHDLAIDFDSLAITLPGISANAQEEQTTQLNAATTLSGIQFVDSTGTASDGNTLATSEADDEGETSAVTATGGTSTNPTPYAASRLNADCCDQIGLIASIPSGDQESRATSVDAATADTYACPTTGVRETDLLACAAGHVRQVGTIAVSVPVTHVTSAVGSANLLRIVGPSTDTTAKIDRDASAGTAEDGLIDVQASRTLGTVQLGGFPSSGMTAPSNMSTNQSLDTNYCVRLVGYSDTVRAIAGERQATDPSADIPAGTFFYYTGSGSGYSNKSVTDATLDTLVVTCSKTQVVGVSTVTWRVTVAAGGVKHATTTTSQTADPADVQTRWDAEASVQPIEITIRYEYIVDGVNEISLLATFDPGDLFAHGIYQPPPAAQV